MKYDIYLLEQLNEEWRSRPIMSTFPQYDAASQLRVARERLRHLDELVPLGTKKVLEVGCGRGYVSFVLRSEYKCSVVAIDVRESEEWLELRSESPDLTYQVVDLSQRNPFEAETFDLIVSYAVWEHIKHPFSILKECCKIVKPQGHIFIFANQYRSALASHLYRHIHFPFPHLLFEDDVVAEYCIRNGISTELGWFYYVNKLTYSHYREYFRILGLGVEHERLLKRPLDNEFYDRFRDKLELYPRFDLELDFFEVLLQKQSSDAGRSTLAAPTSPSDAVSRSFSYRLGNTLVEAVVHPGRNTILLPYRLIRLFVAALRKRRTGAGY